MKYYDCYRCVTANKEILRISNASLAEALRFFDQERKPLVKDENHKIYYTKEELKNAKGFRSKPKPKLDYEFTDDGQILKNSDTKLSGVDTDNSESSSECDN
jgi:hypothetical protein